MRLGSIFITILFIFTIALTGCGREDHFIVWSEKMDHTELRASAIKRLENAKIEYKVDDKNNVLIKEKDLNAATRCCS